MREWAGTRSARMARTVWLVLAVVGSVLYFAGPISQWRTLQTACYPDSACQQYQLDRTAVRLLGEHGVSPADYAVFSVVVLAAFWALWYGLSALVIMRRPDDRGAVLSAYFLAVFPSFEGVAWLPINSLVSLLGNVFVPMLLIFALLFPDGRFSPRWARWIAGAVVFFFAVITLPLPRSVVDLESVLIVGLFVAVVGAQIYRYRFTSTGTQQQQIKWALAGLAGAILGIAATWFIVPIAPFGSGQGSLYGSFTDAVGTAIIASFLPISIAVAVLRNHLWDIDRVISRALAYTILTLTLAAIYAGSVVGLQTLSRSLVGQSSDIAIALSTLIIAALFGPLRRRVQAVIDRRFYRRRYDAEHIMAGLGERLRDQVDLTQLSDELTLAIHQTLHPAHMTLWIRDGDGQRPAQEGVPL